jgi:hypothetical protein
MDSGSSALKDKFHYSDTHFQPFSHHWRSQAFSIFSTDVTPLFKIGKLLKNLCCLQFMLSSRFFQYLKCSCSIVPSSEQNGMQTCTLLSSLPFSGDITSQMEQNALVLDRTSLNNHTHHSNVPSRK